MDFNLIGTFLCGAGILQSLFLSLYFFANQKIERRKRNLLGFLFLLITIRLVKSIGWYFFAVENDIFLNIGFAAHAFVGPVLVCYLAENLPSHPLKPWILVLLFVTPTALLVSIPFLHLETFWYSGGYMGLLYLTILYVLYGLLLLKRIYSENREAFGVISSLFYAIGLFNILYFTNYILGIHKYITGPILYSIVIYAVSYFVFRNRSFLEGGPQSKYQNINMDQEQLEHYSHLIKKVMDEERPYLSGDFNLTLLSERTKTPKYLLSSIFSTVFGQSFSDFTNAYRIEEAKKMLVHQNFQNRKIASIAYDCGFNSISAFNASFKKLNNCSPSEYRSRTKQAQ